MAYVIAQPCIGVKDTACIKVCPVDAIHPTPDEPDFGLVDQLYISDQCIDCHMCVDECPVGAIFAPEDLPEIWRDFIEKNAKYYRDRAAK